MSLGKEELILLGRKAVKIEPVDLPEGAGRVFLRVMSGRDRDSYEEGNYTLVGGKVKMSLVNVRARLLVRCLCDQEGKRLFTDAEAGIVGEWDGLLLDLLFSEAKRLNKLTREEEDKDKQLFTNGLSCASGSALPATSE